MMQAQFGVASRVVRAARWLSFPILAWLAAAALLVLFGHLGGEIGEGETAGFDNRSLQAAQALRDSSSGLSAAMRDWSGVGGKFVLSFVTLGACVYFALIRARRTAVLMLCSVLSASAAVHFLKAGFARDRPPSAFAQYVETGLSFPSGHTSMSTVVFLTLGFLLARVSDKASERVLIVALSAFVALMVGLSRAALGVHWATDVIGAWAFGTAWAMAWLLVARHVSPKGLQ